MSRKRRTTADEPHLLVRTSASDHADGGSIAPHTHDWHQLIHVRSGLMTVRTSPGSWIAPPAWAIWVPAGVPHSLRFAGASALRTLYVRPPALPGVGPAGSPDVGPASSPGGCRSLAVSPLLRELIARTADLGMLDGRDPVEEALATLIAGELAAGVARRPPLNLPEPSSPAATAAATLLSTSDLSTAAVARRVGLGVRTLERRFLDETGLTLGRWRRHRRLLRGLESIAAGATVQAAAATAGYGSASAFISAFRTAFGETPSRYF
jgi:AraC-like DNA-binding protein